MTAVTPEDLGFDSERLGRIGDLCGRYVDSGRIPCAQVAVARAGTTVYEHTCGMADLEAAEPLRTNAIFRIYSMTKPITSIALMQLYEQGLVLLENPVGRFVPELADPVVWVAGDLDAYDTRPASRQITVRDLLTHTSGLTYGFQHQHPIDAMYRKVQLGDFGLPDFDLAEAMVHLGGIPLLFDPGTAWNYSVSTDVCGRIVEVVSGQSLDAYLRDHVFEPLGMVDTGFSVPDGQADRFTTNYAIKPGDRRLFALDPRDGSRYLSPPKFLSGGGGLVSTTADYLRFANALVDGGALDGERIIGRKTLAYMTLNHLPDGKTLNEMDQSTFAEVAMEGTGFGLGFSVMVDPAAGAAVGSPGEYAWGGAASTVFWVDPVEQLSVVFMTQVMPSNHYPHRRQVKSVVYQAHVD